MELCLKTYGGFVIIVGWMEVDYQVNCCGCFFPLHTISESGLDWVAEEWRVVAVGNNNNKRIGERKAPLSTVMQLHNEDMIYVGWRPQRDGLKSCIYTYVFQRLNCRTTYAVVNYIMPREDRRTETRIPT